MSQHDRSDEAQLVRTSVSDVNGVKQRIEHSYTPPLDGTKDDLDRFDMGVAKKVCEVLVNNFPGYPWKVVAETRQGIVMFQIPELMGATLYYVIRLGEFPDLTPKFIIACAGELLERMKLRRGPVNLAEYFAAKNNKEKFDFSGVQGA